MGRRLKQIKRSDLCGLEKQIVESLIDGKPRNVQKEEKHEMMRCKIEIFEGSVKRELVDSFIVNTNSLDDTIEDIISKYGDNTQFTITNLFDEKIISKRFVYTGAGEMCQDNYQLEVLNKIKKLKDEGKTQQEIYEKTSHIAARTYVKEILKDLERPEQLLIIKDLNINESIVDNNKEPIKSGDNNEK